MLEFQCKHRNLGNQQITADEGADENDPFQSLEAHLILIQSYDERTPEQGVGRGGQADTENAAITKARKGTKGAWIWKEER